MLKSKFLKNVSWIFLGNAIHAVLQFLLNVFAARILTEYDYGLINYSLSIVALFSAVCTLGFNGVITKKFAENELRGGEYLLSAILVRVILSIPAILTVFIIGYIHAPSDHKLHLIMLCQALSLLMTAGDLLVYWFRFKYKASLVAILRFVSFGIMAIWRVIALVVYKSTWLYVVGTVLETGVFSALLLFAYFKMHQPRLSFSFIAVKDMLKISYPFIFSAILATVYGQTDKIMLESMVSTESVAYYSVSLTLAGAISIIPTALIEGFRPEILKYKETSESDYIIRFRQLYGLVFWICVAYCIVVTIFAKIIILFLYGEKYLPAVSSLSLIVWYTSFSYFGSINNIYMVAESKTKWVQVITLAGALLNIALNAVLIPLRGIDGAAIASLITQVVANFILLLIIKPLRPCFNLVVNGIFLRGILPNRKK